MFFKMTKMLLALSVIAGGAVLAWRCYGLCCPREFPKLDYDEWWGPKELKSKNDTSVRPFRINFTHEMVSDLKNRLLNRRKLTPPLDGIAFEYGFNTANLETVLDYWQNKYDFSKRQDFLNQYPQFTTNIQGLNIHFIRVKPQVSKDTIVLPILLLHGWPGSVREFYEIIPLLTKKRPGCSFVFEVIVPSLPGYGFSDSAIRPGLSTVKIAIVMRNLMHRIGHKKFYVQGGDWGAITVAHMSTIFPEEILGHHSNLPLVRTTSAIVKTLIGSFFPSLVVEDNLAERMYPLSTYFARIIEESGYFHLQATKPDTVGVGLSDSPAGLAAYMLEKLTFWTDFSFGRLPDGGLTKKYTLDQLLDNLMMYWASNCAITAARLYAEEMSMPLLSLFVQGFSTTVPTWVLQTRFEINYQPPSFLRSKYVNLLGATVLEDGGHFIVLEQPEVVAEDIYKAVTAFLKWHSDNNSGKTEL